MKKINVLHLVMVLLLCAQQGMAQEHAIVDAKVNKDVIQKSETMKTYLIEREIPEAGKLTAEQLKEISQKSNTVLSAMGPDIEWIHSYVTENKVYCIYKAANEDLIRGHAEKGNFPVNNIEELSTVIDPGTGKN